MSMNMALMATPTVFSNCKATPSPTPGPSRPSFWFSVSVTTSPSNSLTSPPHRCAFRLRCGSTPNSNSVVVAAAALGSEPLHVMISGAPASGKGTQCELIKNKYGLVHVAAGDLLRAEIATGSGNGKLAKQYMEKGQLVPDQIVVMMVKDRLLEPDAKENGWLLDGYPRSLSQATGLKGFGFEPDIFLLLEVSEDVLVERVVGRRLDPVTGKIYHLKYSPPETKEIAARLTQRFDDTEEKINGNVSKEEVFTQIDRALTSLLEQKKAASGSVAA